MKTQNRQQQVISVFETEQKKDQDGKLYWNASSLARLLGYINYKSFLPVVEKAKISCRNSGQNELDHFEDSNEILISDKKVNPLDVRLSRYASYLCMQNADPSFEEVALVQTYFAMQSRLNSLMRKKSNGGLKAAKEKRIQLREMLSKHNLKLASAAKKAGIKTPLDYALFQNHGYMGLYGGLEAKDIHQRKHLADDENILDHMDSPELAANIFRVLQTEQKLNRDKIQNVEQADNIHFSIGQKIRNEMELMGNVLPEDLPRAKSLKKSKKATVKLKKGSNRDE